MNLGETTFNPLCPVYFISCQPSRQSSSWCPNLDIVFFFFFFYFISVPFCFQGSQTLSHFLVPIGLQSWGQEYEGLDIRCKTSVFGKYPWLTFKPNVLHTRIHVSLEHSWVLENLPLSCICEPMDPWRLPPLKSFPSGVHWKQGRMAARDSCLLLLSPMHLSLQLNFWDSDFALDLCSTWPMCLILNKWTDLKRSSAILKKKV